MGRLSAHQGAGAEEAGLAKVVRTPQSDLREPPSSLAGVLRSLGPGIVVTGSVIGAGELINTPQRASNYGYAILWAVILSCIIKYWLQMELGRFCLANNLTTIQALNTLPGPKWRRTHIIPLLYMFGFVLSMATVAGILTATAGLFNSVCQDLFPSNRDAVERTILGSGHLRRHHSAALLGGVQNSGAGYHDYGGGLQRLRLALPGADTIQP